MKTIKDQIIEKLTNTGRPGRLKLIAWLVKDGYFEAPASTRFHGCYKGGLAQHSWDVCLTLEGIMLGLKGIDKPIDLGQRPLPVRKDNIVIAALLHDINKVGRYVPATGKYPYRSVKGHPKGHGELSITFASKYIELEPIEIIMIRFHMGIHGAIGYAEYDAEYPLKNQHKKKYKPKSKMTPTEVAGYEADQEKRYCTSLRNAWYHNPIAKFLSIADELATMEEKCKEYRDGQEG